ncbi:hypothetical protein PVIIG_02695 [Plasmodium vivax India VII]|uniref:Uncharacterized protein n=1 Tax=Plasmodium vivax India VII TaxID=1077284 RepID=A0A0J9V5E5_PLAVI|nr:hypothetical protein PVIIG_02695 [Plasmodium vivax India VII]
MAKPAAPAVVSAVDLEKDATDLNLHTLHKDFFVIPKTLKTDSNCDPLEKQQKGAKNLCNSAVHFVKELSGKQGTENYRRCKYLPYWLHDEIGKLYKEHNKNIDSIPFIKPLIEAVDKATKTITNDKCNSLHYDGSITLDEWKARKLLYIYFKNFDELSREVSRPSNDKCRSSKREHGKKKHKSVDYCDYNDYGDYDNHDGDGKYDDDGKHDDHDNRDKYDDNAGYGDYDSYDEYEEELSRRGPENSHRDRQRREDNILYKVPLHSLYSLLDEKYSDSDSYEICQEQIESYHGEKKEDVLSLCRQLESIFHEWDSVWLSLLRSGHTTYCDSMNYWFYNKIKDNQFSNNAIELLYKAWEEIIKEKKFRNKCELKRHIYSSTEVLENKKKLYDFLLCYDKIKEALQASKNSKKDKYCSYLWAIFSLYVKMKHDNTLKSGVYSEEIENFEKIFINGSDKLALLKEKCPGICLDLLLNSQNTNVCSLEENNYIKYLPEKVWLEDTTKKVSKLHLQESTRGNAPLKNRFVKTLFDNVYFHFLIKLYVYLII